MQSDKEVLRNLSLAIDSYTLQLERKQAVAASGNRNGSPIGNPNADPQEKYNLLSRLNTEIPEVRKLLEQESEQGKQDDIALLGLCLKPIKTIVGLTNHLSQPNIVDVGYCEGAITAAAKRLQFLLRETQDFLPEQELAAIDPWQIADDALCMLSPLLSHRGISVNINVSRQCPAILSVQEGQSKSLLFQFLLHYFLHTRQNNLDLTLAISFMEFDELVFSLDDENYPSAVTPGRRFGSLITQGTTFEDGLLSLPAKASDTLGDNPGEGLTGIIICEQKLQRDSLYERLAKLGVKFTDNFQSPDINFCLIADEKSLVFDGPLPDAGVSILLLNNITLYQRNNWQQLKNPVDQSEIRQILSNLQSGSHQLPAYSILAVDDNAANLNLIKLQLTQLGHHVTTADNGSDALELCHQNHFNLIFLDIQMPDMSGVEVAERLSALDPPPIIGLTAHATSEERESYQNSGMSQVVVKPINNDNLKSLLRRYIENVETPVPAPASQIDSEVIFDRELSLSTVNDRPEVASKLFELLMSTLPEDQRQINLAFNNEDYQAMAAAVHKLHGAIRYCGVPRLGRAVDELESSVKAGDKVTGALDTVNNEISTLMAWQQENPSPFATIDATDKIS